MSLLRVLLAGGIALGGMAAAQAHQVNLSTARVMLDSDHSVSVEVGLKGSDADRLAGTRIFDAAHDQVAIGDHPDEPVVLDDGEDADDLRAHQLGRCLHALERADDDGAVGHDVCDSHTGNLKPARGLSHAPLEIERKL